MPGKRNDRLNEKRIAFFDFNLPKVHLAAKTGVLPLLSNLFVLCHAGNLHAWGGAGWFSCV